MYTSYIGEIFVLDKESILYYLIYYHFLTFVAAARYLVTFGGLLTGEGP